MTVDQIPAHDHKVLGGWGAGATDFGSFRVDQNSPANPWARTGATGGNQPHENMPPYRTIYMWLRTA